MNTLTLELPDEVVVNLRKQAQKAHLSVEKFVAESLSRQFASDYDVKTLRRDEILRQRERFTALLQKLGEPEIEKIKQALSARETVEPESDLDESVERKLRSKMTLNAFDQE